MDIPRDPKPKTRRRVIQWSVAAIGVILITGVLRNLQPAAPSVDAATVWMDTVEHGTMVRQVRGPGTLVPEQMRWLTALTAGRVEQIIILPGTEIEANTVIIRMSNPDVEIQLLQAQQQLSSAEAGLIQLRATLLTQRLTQAGLVAQTRTLYQNAQRDHATNQRLYDTNPELVAATELARTSDAVSELEERLALEEERLAVFEASVEDQLDAQQIQINRLSDIVKFNQNRVASFEVTAGVSGVLAELPLEEGPVGSVRRYPCSCGAAGASQGGDQNPADAGPRHRGRTVGIHRHAQRHHRGSRGSYRPFRPERHRDDRRGSAG